MTRNTKIWLIIATSLVLLGCVLFVGVMFALQWDFTKLSTVPYETNSYTIHESYKNIRIISNTASIEILPSDSASCTVICHEQSKVKHTVEVKSDTLIIQAVDTRKWYEHIAISFGVPKITVYLPQEEYGTLFVDSDTSSVQIAEGFKFESIDISVSTGNVVNKASVAGTMKIKTSTGSIRVENASANALDLTVTTGSVTVSQVECKGTMKVAVSTGKATLSHSRCKNLISSGSTGDISLNSVVAAEKFSIERNTGSVTLTHCDAAEIYIKTDTGDVKGSLLSDKVFLVQTDTGRVDVPKTVSGGRCQIDTDTGDITITIL